jgi:hypothetical protein
MKKAWKLLIDLRARDGELGRGRPWRCFKGFAPLEYLEE